ncbi:acyl carrier protein [Nocardia sp. BMG111209]|uniref:acyl carrier protein n=1 Tax=Nocardia sp. BMG111209 TaxID=1160137 RepID=UPI0003728B4F|nr:phosphopantetheine-binding protein [Nocardia sp. BMG111209]
MTSRSLRQDELWKSVVEVISREFDVPADNLEPETLLLHIEGADSIKQLRAVTQLEHMYGVTLMTAAVPPAQSLSDLVTQIGGLREASGGQ